MTTSSRIETLCAVIDHPELGHLDDEGIRTWANAHNMTLHRDWRGLLCTTLADAYKLREILDADNARQAESHAEHVAALAAQTDAAHAPIIRRIELSQRRSEILASLDADLSTDERFLNWDARATERGEALFEAPIPTGKPQIGTPMERLLSKRHKQ